MSGVIQAQWAEPLVFAMFGDIQRRLKYEKVHGWTTITGNQIYFTSAGHVDLDKLNMFAV
jgi:hypothetical protein